MSLLIAAKGARGFPGGIDSAGEAYFYWEKKLLGKKLLGEKAIGRKSYWEKNYWEKSYWEKKQKSLA